MRSKFARNVFRLAGGTAIGQAIALVALPLITRLYAPEEFGFAATFMAIVAITSNAATLRYEMAIPLSRNASSAVYPAILAAAASAAIATMVGGAGFFFGFPGFLLFAGILVVSLYHIASKWAARVGDFTTVAWTRVSQGVSGAISQIGFGLLGFGYFGLIVGQIIGQSAGLSRLSLGMWRTAPRKKVRFRRIAWAAKRYRRFPLYDLWSILIGNAGAHAPLLILAVGFSPTHAGYYALANRIVAAPVALIGGSISKVFHPQAVRDHHNGNLATNLLRMVKVTAWALVPFTAVAIAAPFIIVPIFGPQWETAGLVLTWAALWGGAQFIASPISVALLALERQSLNLALQITLMVARIAGLLVGVALGSFGAAIMLFSLASIGSYLVMLMAIERIVGARLLSKLLLPVLVSVAALAGAWLWR